MTYKIEVIDLHEMESENIKDSIEVILSPYKNITNLQIVPVTTSYTRPSDGYHDYHYVDRCLILTFEIEE